jgi:DNA repair protein RecN (Recombination protein N)
VIKSFFAKECIGFDEINLELERGLTVFSGPSGAGKSVLMGALMCSFGLGDSEASVCESVIKAALPTGLSALGIEDDGENVFRMTKKDKARYFVNGQSVSKKALAEAAKGFARHLSSSGDDEFSPSSLLAKLDEFAASDELDGLKAKLATEFHAYKASKTELARLAKLSQEADEQREFLSFEIAKIESVNPREGEDDELLALKKSLSKKEKTVELVGRCQTLSSLKEKALSLYVEMGESDEVAVEFFGQFEELLGSAQFRLRELDDMDADTIMNRLEELAGLKKRYGGVAEALEALANKKTELKKLESITIEMDELEAECAKLGQKCEALALGLSALRKKTLKGFEGELGGFLIRLFLPPPTVSLVNAKLCAEGIDSVTLLVGTLPVNKLSAGEFRRARLALMCVGLDSSSQRGALFFDEADANVSGEESAAIAKTLRELSSAYQIFAISHQPQLTALATNHYLVVKSGGGSNVARIDGNERIQEIARIISGETITAEALEYAKTLLKESSC